MSKQELRRQRVGLGVHPGDVRGTPAGPLECRFVLVDAGDEGAEVDELERLAPRAAEKVEHMNAGDAPEPLADPGWHPRGREDVFGSAVSLVEGAAVVIRGLHD